MRNRIRAAAAAATSPAARTAGALALAALAVLASPAPAIGFDTRGTGDVPPTPPPPPVVTCSISDGNIKVTSFADILGYQLSGSCVVTFPGTNIKPQTSAYEGGGSWNSNNGMVNEFIKGRDAKGQVWEIQGGGTCKLDPWMTGPAGASCSTSLGNHTPNAPASLVKHLKVPISASVLDGQARAALTAKTFAAIQLEHRAPEIYKPSESSTVSFPSNLEIAPYLDSPAKTFALEWQAIVNGAWTPQNVMDQAGLVTPLPAGKFGASQIWRVRARQHQSTKASWSGWRMFQVLPNAPACANAKPYGATYDVSATPASIKAGATIQVPIKVTNGSNQVWGAGTNFHLSYHWAQNGAVVINDGERTTLPNAVQPCGTIVLSATVKAPPSAGTWEIRWDMVLEGVTWFSTQGVPTGNRTVTVTP